MPRRPGRVAGQTRREQAEVTDVTDPTSTVSLAGDQALQVTMTDKGEPGESDSITVQDSTGGVWFSSRWEVPTGKPAPTTGGQLLARGNLVVHERPSPARETAAARAAEPFWMTSSRPRSAATRDA